nr:hypothetical protein [Candidatus Levybacteria bacterium]
MTAEAGSHLEQDPNAVSQIRNQIRDIYGLPEMQQAVIEHYMGRVDQYSAEQFRKSGTVTIKKGLFVFHFYPRLKPDRDVDYSSLVMARSPLLINMSKIEDASLKPYTEGLPVNDYTLAGRITINASSPDKIDVDRENDWLYEGGLDFVRGEEALDLAEEVINSFINPKNQTPQIPQV